MIHRYRLRRARAWFDAPAVLEVLVGPDRYLGAVVRAFAAFAIPALLLGLALTIVVPDQPEFDRDQIAAGIGAALSAAIVIRALAEVFPRWLVVPSVVVVGAGIGFFVPYYGPSLAESSVLVTAGATVASLWVTRRHAVLAIGAGSLAYAVSLVLNDMDAPAVRWMQVVGSAIVVLVAASRVLDLVNDLAAEERAAAEEVERLVEAERAAAVAAEAARAELAELNHSLEARVARQVEQIEGLGELRRFLSPQVADAILAAGDHAASDALRPHRRRIAVVFCDLRGFTSFTNSSEPDDVLEVLDAFFQVVGRALDAHGATVGPFQGDGVMAYFNDPVPCDDPATTAVTMMVELRAPLDALCAAWAERGFQLGYGCGIAYGYATLGTVGFEGRSDYTPLGNVVNIAARLADEAGWGEILLDGRTHHALDEPPDAAECLLPLKGFERPVVAYRLAARLGPVSVSGAPEA
ncbi:MAG: adenylate/guanylate cyclase domain-containing protein [Actinomycetota bacterium]|nr:adenylate/guanylate cyclase domain-containing protein [Actinomycetota bacterium]